MSQVFKLVPRLGFEPRLEDSKSSVLPLDDLGSVASKDTVSGAANRRVLSKEITGFSATFAGLRPGIASGRLSRLLA